MKIANFLLIASFVLASGAAYSQGTAPTFRYNASSGPVTLPGQDPAHSGTTVIPTVLVPVRLEFEASRPAKQQVTLDATRDVPQLLHSPVFAKVSFGAQGTTQYAEGPTQYMDAMLRATTGAPATWHTLLGLPVVHPVTVKIPAGYGYVLTSRRTGTTLAMADAEYVQREIFKQIPQQQGKLVIAVTRNTAYYTYGDATVCCSWGTHGVDEATGNSFVLASYLGTVPPLVEQRDIQPLTEQLAEWVNDPLHDALVHVDVPRPLPPGENVIPSWKWPTIQGVQHRGCGGNSPATRYTLQDPLDTNDRSQLPADPAWIVNTQGRAWHLANVALINWYTAGTGPYSFPNARLLPAIADRCPVHGPPGMEMATEPAPSPALTPVPSAPNNNGHALIGYWTGYGRGGTLLRLRDVSPQWDVIIVAFANVNHQAPEGTMQMHVGPMPSWQSQIDPAQMKEDIASLKSQGKKVLISLGGGGEYFTLAHQESIPTFVNSVTQIVADYGFDGIDLDFETPSLVLDPGDTDFRHPKTASIVNLITALRQLREHFGPNFMLTLVPEGPQIPGGYATYGGQFGTYLPLLWGVKDILSFVDIQDYNTPPFEGLDGEIYQLGSANYDAAMTELLLHGFPVAGFPAGGIPVGARAQNFFPPLPANKVAVGFLVGTATPKLVSEAMQYLITGKAPAGLTYEGQTYKLQRPAGYPAMIGAMFWTIDDDLGENYTFSNVVGPQLHGYSTKSTQPRQKPGKR